MTGITYLLPLKITLHYFETELADLAFDATYPHDPASDGAPDEWATARRRNINASRTNLLQALNATDGQPWPFHPPTHQLRLTVSRAGSDALSFVTTLSGPTNWGIAPALWKLEGDQRELDRIRQYAEEFRRLSDSIEAVIGTPVLREGEPPPAGSQQSEGGTRPADDYKPNGPFGADGFRFAGVEVKFGRAAKQYGLVIALWDAENKCPAEPRPIEDVIADVWGDDNNTEDSTFRQLCTDTRRRFEAANCPLKIHPTNGKAELSPL